MVNDHAYSSSASYVNANDAQSHDRYRDSNDYELGESPRRSTYEEKTGIGRVFRKRGRRCWTVFATALLLLVCFGAYRYIRDLPLYQVQAVVGIQEHENVEMAVEEPTLSPPTYPAEVLGPPTESFWDNMRNDTQYITGWVDAGWTNNFMTIVNLLYVALLANRTAVLPPSVPIHVPSEAGFPYFSDVIDLPHLSSAIRLPIIEWSDLKLKTSTHPDKLGCWSTWADIVPTEHYPRHGLIPGFLHLDVSYTPVPKNAKLLENHVHDPHVRFAPLAAMTFTDGRIRAHLPEAAPFPSFLGHKSLPSTHMACFDFLYYASAVEPFEYEHDFAPAWSFIGTHAHWTSHILAITRDALAKTFQISGESGIPPFISMHIRHGDFGRLCPNPKDPFNACFAPLTTFAARINDIKSELKAKGTVVDRVLITSDEENQDWWKEVRDLGWVWIDHEALRTVELFGAWYLVFIDAVSQSLGSGFVGTESSTMSLMAGHRVSDWNNGPVRYVKWDGGRLV